MTMDSEMTAPDTSTRSIDPDDELTPEDGPPLPEQARALAAYLDRRLTEDGTFYEKSRFIAEELDLSAKEVGTNMPAIREADLDIEVEKWGYSSSTTWMVTA